MEERKKEETKLNKSHFHNEKEEKKRKTFLFLQIKTENYSALFSHTQRMNEKRIEGGKEKFQRMATLLLKSFIIFRENCYEIHWVTFHYVHRKYNRENYPSN